LVIPAFPFLYGPVCLAREFGRSADEPSDFQKRQRRYGNRRSAATRRAGTDAGVLGITAEANVALRASGRAAHAEFGGLKNSTRASRHRLQL
jgi:hypothetical protein